MGMVYECLYALTTVAVNYYKYSFIIHYNVLDCFSMIANDHKMKAY